MTDIRIDRAFAHPETRAAAETGPQPDRISLRDHVRTVEIGAFQEERGQPQRLSFDIAVDVAPADAADDVDRILSYDRLAEAVDAELQGERLNLLETLAERVAERILREPRADRVILRVQKLDRAPGRLGVEIVRQRRAPLAPAAAPATPRARVVPLAWARRSEPGLIDALAAAGPVVLCPEPADLPVPAAPSAQAQRHIGLLARDQAAWAWAAAAPRCAVAASLAEIDWLLRQGRVPVWAPSQMMRQDDAADPAAWLAARLGNDA